MKILMVIDSLDKGGKERRMLELIKGLVASGKGFEIFLVSLSPQVDYPYVYDLPIRFEILPRKGKKDPFVPMKLRRILREFRPDIIHTWSTMAAVYLAIAQPLGGPPVINGSLADAHPDLGWSDKHYRRIKMVTPVTRLFISNSLAGIRSYRTPARRSICIYNGMDFGRFENLLPVADMEKAVLGGEKGDRTVIVMMAAVDERKDYDSYVTSAIEIHRNHPDTVFLIIGGGHDEVRLKERVKKEGADGYILFTGKMNNVESVLQATDIGVLLTNARNHAEGISNSILEYMAMGLPVIASKGGGTDEIVEDGKNGFLIPPFDPKTLTDRLDRLIRDKDLRKRYGQQGAALVREKFNIRDKTGEYLEAYGKVLGRSL